MIRNNYLDISKLIRDKSILKLFRAVEDHGGVLRFVGGAVRDALMGIDGFDLDLATDLSPDELVEACEDYDLKTVPIGIKFGTVGVVINNNVLEVTSLRQDVKTDGRYAEVIYTNDWEVDASRRDLTINAVYADEKGNVFDYYNGISDLENGIVKFIGSPNIRIKEDYLRILRFFRFYSTFGKGPIDKKALKACIDNKDGLKTLSMERIRDEMKKILLSPKAAETIRIMFENEIFSNILMSPKSYTKLDFLVELTAREKIKPNALRRLFVIYDPNEKVAETIANQMKLSKNNRQTLVRWATINPDITEFFDESKLLKLIYHYGKEFCIDKLLIMSAINEKEVKDLSKIIKFIEDAVVPIFPIRGRDVVGLVGVESSQIGELLKNLEKQWIDSDFMLSRFDLLGMTKK